MLKLLNIVVYTYMHNLVQLVGKLQLLRMILIVPINSIRKFDSFKKTRSYISDEFETLAETLEKLQ